MPICRSGAEPVLGLTDSLTALPTSNDDGYTCAVLKQYKRLGYEEMPNIYLTRRINTDIIHLQT